MKLLTWEAALLLTRVVVHTSASSTPPPPTAACPTPISTGSYPDPQDPRSTFYNFGCFCTADQCGEYPIPPAAPEDENQALVVTSSQASGLFSHDIVNVNTSNGGNATATMTITARPDQTHQEIMGLGASITDAVAYVLTELFDNEATMDQVLSQSFDQAGLSFTRVPMGSADFSRRNYAMAHELDLSDFCLRDDTTPEGQQPVCGKDYKLDVLERIINGTGNRPDLKIIVSAWSPAPEFKTQNFTCDVPPNGLTRCRYDPNVEPRSRCGRIVGDPNTCMGQNLSTPCPATPPNNYEEGFPLVWQFGNSKAYNSTNIPMKNANDNCYYQGPIAEEAYEPWAQVYAKFIEAYGERLGLPVWGVTSQNEPYTQTGLWPQTPWTVPSIIKFVNNNLAPAIKAVNPDVKVMVFDDQLIYLTTDARAMMEGTIDSADGVAYHWYQTVEAAYENSTSTTSVPGTPPVGGGLGVSELYNEFKDKGKFMLMTEMCNGYLLGTGLDGPIQGSFQYAYQMAHDILWQFRNFNSGYIYWNLILDDEGGPNLAGNYVDSPMYAVNATSFVMNPSFYYLAHFSRFIPPGSKMIDADVSCGADKDAYCQFVAFRTPADDVVVVMTNDQVSLTAVPSFTLSPLAKGQGSAIDWTINCGSSSVSGTLEWKSIQTVVLSCPPSAPTTAPVTNEPATMAPTSQSTCTETGGNVTTSDCSCLATLNFPGTCGIGSCSGCPPGNSTNEISVCECPEGTCFVNDAIGCVNETQVETLVANFRSVANAEEGAGRELSGPSSMSVFFIASSLLSAVDAIPVNLGRRLEDSTEVKTHLPGSLRRLASNTSITLTVVASGAPLNCAKCPVAIYDTSSCIKEDIEAASTLYDNTKLQDDPWLDITYSSDENGDAFIEVDIDHGLPLSAYLDKAIVLSDSAGSPYACGLYNVDDPATTCTDSGGTVSTTDCSCSTTEDFPNTCAVGACGCPPGGEPNEIDVCECPPDTCFDGIECYPVTAPTDAPVDVPTDAPTSGAAVFKQVFFTTVLIVTVTTAGAILSY